MYRTLSYLFSSLLHRLRLIFARPSDPVDSFNEIPVVNADHEINSVLIHAFSLGSEPAFRHIYDHYAPAIYRVACRYFQSEALAETLVQKVFSALWFERARFREADEIKFFLFTTAKNEAVKLLKKMAGEVLKEHPQPFEGS
jgi:hypothetical protein